MTNKKLLILAGIAAVLLSGCGGEKGSSGSAPAPSAQEPATEAQTEATPAEEAEAVNPADYLVQDPSEYITLGSLDGLTATQTVYEITDEMVQEQIENELYMYGTENEAEKAAEGSIVYADVVSQVQGDESTKSDESTYFTIGDGDYGDEFDQHLIGAAVDDELDFTVSYGDDTWTEEWIGQTVEFHVTVTGIYEMSVPEYNDDFVTNYTEYSSKSEYEDSIREMLASDYEQSSYTEAVNSLFQAVMDRSAFNGYPEDLYASCEDEIISYYGQFSGEEDTDAILETLGLTKDDLQEDILYTVNYRLLISAICAEQGIEVTADEYTEEINNASLEYGYPDAAAYEADMGRESVVWSLYENKVADYLYNQADITINTADASAAEEEPADMDEEALTEAETPGAGADITPAEELEAVTGDISGAEEP